MEVSSKFQALAMSPPGKEFLDTCLLEDWVGPITSWDIVAMRKTLPPAENRSPVIQQVVSHIV